MRIHGSLVIDSTAHRAYSRAAMRREICSTWQAQASRLEGHSCRRQPGGCAHRPAAGGGAAGGAHLCSAPHSHRGGGRDRGPGRAPQRSHVHSRAAHLHQSMLARVGLLPHCQLSCMQSPCAVMALQCVARMSPRHMTPDLGLILVAFTTCLHRGAMRARPCMRLLAR